MATNRKKDKFYNVLKNIFIGAKIEGNSGYVNLMRIKNKYYQDFKGQLASDINQKLEEVGRNFEEELYNKLYTFFKKYFSESGSIYFTYTPLQEKVYERIYRDDKDVMLFWKTNMLYYVKTERLFENMDFYDDDNLINYHFDVSELEHKQNNEKKELIFELIKAEHQADNSNHIFFSVKYSFNGTKTKIEQIVKEVKKQKLIFLRYNEEKLKRALGIFRKQSEVDYFINKNAKEFLREQFSLWIKTYVFDDDTIFEEARLKQLKALRGIAYNIIDLVSQFEDELVKIWNKPKFAHSSNYVITLDKVANKNLDLLNRILNSKGIDKQINEWVELGMCSDKFKTEDIFNTGEQGKLDFNENKNLLNPKWQHLPLDTKYFKEFEYDILALFDDLDNQLDGWLIHSENYQALNTIRYKFMGTVKSIYIDPPFNLDKNADFKYLVNYKDASWASLLENRISSSKSLISNDGSMFTRCDYNGNHIVRSILDQCFGKENFKNEIVVNRFKRQLDDLSRLNFATESLFYYGKTANHKPNKIYRKRNCTFCGQEIEPSWRQMSSPGLRESPIESKYIDLYSKSNIVFDKNGKPRAMAKIIAGKELLPPKGRHWTFMQSKIFDMEKNQRVRMNHAIAYKDMNGLRIDGLPEYLQTNETPIDTTWTDLKGYAFGSAFSTENAEELLKRVIEFSSNKNELVLDYFLGSGTTIAVSHKIHRKWIGIELGEHYNTHVLPRIKNVLYGDVSGISKDEDVNWQGGGFFKYYELEQYEETLRKAKYEDKGALPKDIYHQYLFFKDLKLADEVVKMDDESRSIKVDLTKLNTKIDIPETLSFLTGKFIKQILKDKVIFTDGSEIEYANIDYRIVKPLIWW